MFVGDADPAERRRRNFEHRDGASSSLIFSSSCSSAGSAAFETAEIDVS
jgi:hypothetical protein